MRKATSLTAGAVLAAAALALSGCGGSSGASTTKGAPGGGGAAGKHLTINLDYQASPTPTDPWHHMATKWQSLLKSASGGRIEVKLFPGGQLSGGNQQKEVELVQNGTIDASILPSSILANIDPRFDVVGLPWIVPGEQAADKLMDGPLGAQTMTWISNKGLHPLAIASNGFRELGDKSAKVSSPSDVKGLKIRVPGSQVLVDTWKDLGAEPATIDFAELYTALQQGTVDGEELPVPYKVSTKFYEVEKYVTMLNYSFDSIYLTVSPRLWSSLSSADQKLLQTTASEASKDERQFVRSASQDAVQTLQKNGVTVTNLSPAEVAAFQKKVQPVYDEFSGKIGTDILHQWRQQLSAAG